jgi:hypothetical protein
MWVLPWRSYEHRHTGSGSRTKQTFDVLCRAADEVPLRSIRSMTGLGHWRQRKGSSFQITIDDLHPKEPSV